MKTIKLISVFFLFFTMTINAQININKIVNKAKKEINKNKKTHLSNDEIIGGLKQALEVGTNNSVSEASKINGYFGNAKIKIPFPPDVKKIETKARELGMDKEVYRFVLTLNRAAEEASKQAAPVFLDAIKGLTVTDGVKILNGADDAATQYLKQNTSGQLEQKFKPIVRKALQTVKITKYWNPIITTYNKIPFVEQMNPDLEEYTTQKAIQGLFKLIAEEETKIRKDPAARITDLLKKVFGG
jgi:hypothetical protein